MKISITVTTSEQTIEFQGEDISEGFAMTVLREILHPSAITVADLIPLSKLAQSEADRVADMTERLTELSQTPA